MGQTLKWRPTQSTDGRPRWREQKNIYNQRDLMKGRRQFGRHQEVLLVEYQKKRRRIHPRMRPEDGPWPPPQLHRWRSCSLMILPNRWRSPHKCPVLKLASLPNSLYWAYWVWAHSHLQWKIPPNWDPTKSLLVFFLKKKNEREATLIKTKKKKGMSRLRKLKKKKKNT